MLCPICLDMLITTLVCAVPVASYPINSLLGNYIATSPKTTALREILRRLERTPISDDKQNCGVSKRVGISLLLVNFSLLVMPVFMPSRTEAFSS